MIDGAARGAGGVVGAARDAGMIDGVAQEWARAVALWPHEVQVTAQGGAPGVGGNRIRLEQ
jgi:hypothetical protein